MVIRALRGVSTPAAWLALWPLLCSCTQTVPDTSSIVTGARILGVQTVPAEAAPGASVTVRTLYVDPDGTADASSLAWAICTLPKPLGDPGSANPACFGEPSAGLVQLGLGGTAQAKVPEDACQLFGPDVPPAQPGQPSARPTDPDSTGGFYLPVRVGEPQGPWSLVPVRISCAPSGLTQSAFVAFENGYVPNENPLVVSLALTSGPGASQIVAPAGSGLAGATIAAGQRVSLTVAWPACSQAPPCAGAETYVVIDPSTKEIATGRESIVASWYATAGRFDADLVGRGAEDPATSVSNGWTAPTQPGPARLWVVLRDARGGVGWESYVLQVQ